MLGWFRSQAECPVAPALREWIDARWDWLEERFGRERLRRAVVVLPRAEFFPDPYQGTEADVRRMLDRVCGYMALDPATVELSFYEDPACEGRWREHTPEMYGPEEGARFRVWVEAANRDDPLALVAAMAQELARVHLLGDGGIIRLEEAEDHEPLADLVTVFFGLGAFTANAVIRENYWSAGVVSGWSMSRRGCLDMPAYGYAFARFARARDEDGLDWSRELRLDVRMAFQKAMRFLADEEFGPRVALRDGDSHAGVARPADESAPRRRSRDEREDGERENGEPFDEAHDERCDETDGTAKRCHYCGVDLDAGESIATEAREIAQPLLCEECRESIEENRQARAEEAEREGNQRPMLWFVLALALAALSLVALDLWHLYGR